MEEGSLRIDANVSVREPGAPLGTRCEIKNLNSLRSLQRAVDFEAERQSRLLADGGVVVQETRHWDEGAGQTVTMRSKEEAYDYRYFPEPDLVPLAPDDPWRDRVAASLGPMPAARRASLLALLEDPTPSQTDQVAAVVDGGLDGFVVAATARGVTAQLALARTANELAAIEGAERLDADKVATVLEMEQLGELSATQAKTVLADLASTGGDPRELARTRGFERLDDASLDGLLDELISAHPDEWARYREGDEKLSQFFVGQVMRATSGKADGKAVVAGLARRR
jgi:aspartyl-tRNA(Asn)/glutamyl-tRNA(Gln) amidotransferase subunit B